MAPVIKSVELTNEVMLSYVEQGNPSGVPLLLLPGLGDSWRSFELVLACLPESIRAFALTQRGHGDSSQPSDGYRFHDFAADLAAFMDAHHLEAAAIAGHSASGFFAQRFAIDHPERTLGLVFIGSPATLRGHSGLQEVWDSTISKLTDPVDSGFVREIQQSASAQPVPEEFFETLVQEALKVPARVWRAAFKSFLEEDLSGELDKIKVPTLMIWGDRDATVSRRDQEALAAAIVSSRLIVYDGVGHSPNWEEPDRFASDLVAFIENLGN
ncbi:MAG: alpha/beta fold hydrolase [Actinomycetota bacterium]